MTADLFDRQARRLARQRGLRLADPFLLQAAFDDLLGRLAAIDRPKRDLLLVGALDPAWPARLAACGVSVTVFEPAVDGDEDRGAFPATSFDAVIACGTLDTVNDLPRALAALAGSLRPDAPLLGALVGGNSLPQLRRALLAADGAAAFPRAHPRIDAAALSGLLAHAGLAMPVIDIDRTVIRYSSLARLVGDLRAIGATNALTQRSRRSPGQAWRSRLDALFMRNAAAAKTAEIVEILHFLAWSPPG